MGREINLQLRDKPRDEAQRDLPNGAGNHEGSRQPQREAERLANCIQRSLAAIGHGDEVSWWHEVITPDKAAIGSAQSPVCSTRTGTAIENSRMSALDCPSAGSAEMTLDKPSMNEMIWPAIGRARAMHRASHPRTPPQSNSDATIIADVQPSAGAT